MQMDPLVTKCAELFRLGLMPTPDEIRDGKVCRSFLVRPCNADNHPILEPDRYRHRDQTIVNTKTLQTLVSCDWKPILDYMLLLHSRNASASALMCAGPALQHPPTKRPPHTEESESRGKLPLRRSDPSFPLLDSSTASAQFFSTEVSRPLGTGTQARADTS